MNESQQIALTVGAWSLAIIFVALAFAAVVAVILRVADWISER